MIEFLCEWGQVNNLETAIQQATVTKEIGGTYAKWQMFEPENLATKTAVRYWDTRLGGYRTQLDTFRDNGSLDATEWVNLKNYCDEIGIQFLCTPFDLEAVDLLEQMNVSAYKIASGDITYKNLISRIAETGKKVYLSTGASYLLEIQKALRWLDGRDVVLLACDLVYPCEPKDTNLWRIETLSTLFNRQVGYSDHTRQVITGALAVNQGATVLEKHCTLTITENPDSRMALFPELMKVYIEDARAAFCFPYVPSKSFYGSVPSEEQLARIGARRALYATRELLAGSKLRPQDVVALRPCPEEALTPADDFDGLEVTRTIQPGELIEKSCLKSLLYSA